MPIQRDFVQADQVGPGLAFAESASPNWLETMELEQGGRTYPAESVTVERAWYFTLPAGSIDVREAQRS
jgi:hypothetical protein